MAITSTESAAVVDERSDRGDARSFVRFEWLGVLLLWLSFAAVAVVGAGLFRYAHPVSDDYFRAWTPHEEGLWNSIRDEYTGWSGRWGATAIPYLMTRVLDIRHAYGALLAVVTLGFWAGIYVLIRSWSAGLSRAGGALLTLAFVLVYWTTMPAPEETFYWYVGGLGCHWAFAGGMMLVAWLLRMRDREPGGWRGVARLVGVALIAFALPSVHELFGALLGGILLVGAVAAALNRWPSRNAWIVGLVALVIGTWVVLHAPGNNVRMDASAGIDHTVKSAVRESVRTLVFLTTHWLLSPVLLLSTLLLMIHPALRGVRVILARSDQIRLPVPLRWIVPVLGLGFITSGVVMTTYVLGGQCPGRTLDGFYLVFLFTWYLSVILWMEPAEGQAGGARLLRTVAMGLLALALVSTPNMHAGVHDLRHDGPAFDRVMRERNAQIDAVLAQGGKRVHLPAMTARPRMHFNDLEIVNNPADFRNFQVREFYQLESLTIGDE